MTLPLFSDGNLQHLYEAAGCRTQKELAEILGIGQSSVSDAIRRGTLPPEWLITLFIKKRINPEWVSTGHVVRYAVPSDSPFVNPSCHCLYSA